MSKKQDIWVDIGICGKHYFDGKDDKMLELQPNQWVCKRCTLRFDLKDTVKFSTRCVKINPVNEYQEGICRICAY